MRARMIKIGASVALLGALAGGGVAWATAGNDGDESVTGPAAERARAAALAHVGSGQATEVERESEGSAAWEVEIRRADGSTLEVLLDEGYRVLTAEPDSEEPGDDPDEGEADE